MHTSEQQDTNKQSRMQLRDIMHSPVAAIEAETSLGAAARRMRVLNVTWMPVCDGLKLVGLITARDLTMRATAEGLDPQTCTVREVMTRRVVCVEEDQNLHKAAAIMRHYNIFLLPVVNRQQHLVGMVYFNDLGRFLRAA